MYARRWLLRGHLQFPRTQAEHDVAAKPDNVGPVTPFEAKDADVSDALQLEDALQTAMLITRSAAAVAQDAAYTALVAATTAKSEQYTRVSQCLLTELRALRREHKRVKNKLQKQPPRSTQATRLAAEAVKRRALRSESGRQRGRTERKLPPELGTFPSRHRPRSKRRQQPTVPVRQPWC